VLGRHATPAQLLDLAQRRERLEARISTFHDKAVSFLSNCDWEPADNLGGLLPYDTDDATDLDGYDTDDSDGPDHDNPFGPTAAGASDADVGPERMKLFLPSTVGEEECRMNGHSFLVKKELQLRVGQANDALQGLRMAIGKKSFLFRTKLRKSKSKVSKLRSWDSIHLVDKSVRHHAKIYARARQAMVRLGATSELLSKFHILKKDHLKASTAIMDPNARGQRNSSLAWFWSLNVQGDAVNGGLMEECQYVFPLFIDALISPGCLPVYRVHWLRARARLDRWQEEWNLVQHEMQWLVNYFDYQANQWSRRAEACNGDADAGHRCYARKRVAMWQRFASQAKETFLKVG
jgi:hypothetical protein